MAPNNVFKHAGLCLCYVCFERAFGYIGSDPSMDGKVRCRHGAQIVCLPNGAKHCWTIFWRGNFPMSLSFISHFCSQPFLLFLNQFKLPLTSPQIGLIIIMILVHQLNDGNVNFIFYFLVRTRARVLFHPWHHQEIWTTKWLSNRRKVH